MPPHFQNFKRTLTSKVDIIAFQSCLALMPGRKFVPSEARNIIQSSLCYFRMRQHRCTESIGSVWTKISQHKEADSWN